MSPCDFGLEVQVHLQYEKVDARNNLNSIHAGQCRNTNVQRNLTKLHNICVWTPSSIADTYLLLQLVYSLGDVLGVCLIILVSHGLL